MKLFSKSNTKSIPIILESDDFLAYHRVIKLQLAMYQGDTLSVSIDTQITLEAWIIGLFKKLCTFKESIRKRGSTTLHVKNSIIIREIHAELMTEGKLKGQFKISYYGEDGGEVAPYGKFKLKLLT